MSKDTDRPAQDSPSASPPAKKEGNVVKKFGRELWDDHQFWVNTLAVKGGASAVIAAGILGISYAITLPFLVGAFLFTVCGAGLVVGLYGMAAGTHLAFNKLKDIWWKVRNPDKPLPPEEQKKPPKPFAVWLTEKPAIKKILDRPAIQKIRRGRAWRITKQITKGLEQRVISGLAVGGSVVTLAAGAWLLATQIIVLPVIAIGSLITMGTAMALGTIASGIGGLYMSVRGILLSDAKKKTEEAKYVKKTRIAQVLLPSADENSPLLPPDKWILDQAKDIFKTNQPLRKQLRTTALFAGLGLSSVVGGIVAAAIFWPAAPLLALGAGVSGLAGAGVSKYFTGRSWAAFKRESLPALQKDIGARYLSLHGTAISDEWQKRFTELQKQRETERAEKKKREDQAVAQKAERDEQDRLKKEAAEKPVSADPAPVKETAPGSGLGSKVFKFAAEKRKELKEARLARDAKKKQQAEEKKSKDSSPPPAAPPGP